MKRPITQPPWLGPLQAMQQRIDEAVAAGIGRAQAAGRRLACARGCAACCRTHVDIPIYPVELMGIYWFVLERLEDPLRARLQERLADWETLDACPFLVDEACAIHAVRPMACRLFNVFDRACGEGEDAFHTRPQDVLPPPEAAKREALMVMLSLEGIGDAASRRELVESGAVHGLARNLRALPWQNLARRMAGLPCRRQATQTEEGESQA